MTKLNKRAQICNALKSAVNSIEGTKKIKVRISTSGAVSIQCDLTIDPSEVIKAKDDAERYLNELDAKIHDTKCMAVDAINYKSLQALDTLLLLCKAWNHADEFKVKQTDWCTDKFIPLFSLDVETGKFYPDQAGLMDSNNPSLIYFKTSERAEQFGKAFIDLFNSYFLNK